LLVSKCISEIYLIVPFPPPIPHNEKAKLTAQAKESGDCAH
jgi:hypothetical protein